MFNIVTWPLKHELKSDLLIVFLDELSCKRQKFSHHIDEYIRSHIDKFLQLKDFKGEFKEALLTYPEQNLHIKRILLLGTGKLKDLTSGRFRTLGFISSEWADRHAAKHVHFQFNDENFCKEIFINAFAEGIAYQKYKFKLYKSEKPEKSKRTQYIFLCDKKIHIPDLSKVLDESEIVMDAVRIVRDLGNHPSNVFTPGKLKSFAESHFEAFPNIAVKVIDSKGLEKLKFNAMLGVAKGSMEKPYLIIVHYKPATPTTKCLALVGKGVTFDSGGISLKPSEKMDEMKYDMAGAAVTLGALHAAARLKPGFQVVGIIPAVENMPGSNALKPGDILTAFNGKTIEILNTDAEGRLILADAIAYAESHYKPGAIIDLATLTGSCVVALGDKAAGLFSNNKSLSDLLIRAGEETGDRVWPLPLWDSYSDDIKSEIADIKNIGSRWGGAITAAKFLQAFISKSRWAHIDIAGTAYDVKNVDYLSKGATGFGLRLIVSAFRNMEKIL